MYVLQDHISQGPSIMRYFVVAALIVSTLTVYAGAAFADKKSQCMDRCQRKGGNYSYCVRRC